MASLDTVYCKLKQFDMSHVDNFQPENSITSASYLDAPSAHELSVIIPPWHANQRLLSRAAERQKRVGRSVLLYQFDNNILSADADRTLECFDYIAGRISADVERVGHQTIHWTAASLGTSVLMNTVGSKDLPASTLTFTAPEGNLAKALWTGLRTQPLRAQFERRGIDLETLDELWKNLSPTYQAQNIIGANVDMVVSLADQVIKPETAFEFAEALQANGNTVNLHVNKYLGHYGTILAEAL